MRAPELQNTSGVIPDKVDRTSADFGYKTGHWVEIHFFHLGSTRHRMVSSGQGKTRCINHHTLSVNVQFRYIARKFDGSESTQRRRNG